ncbi:MAG: glycosylasparaginase [Phycisphaerales bacterium]|nr:glycosylasparaginase [Phycisphaerales bacterium]
MAALPPMMLATWSFSTRGCVAAWPALAGGGSSLDAVCAAAREAEADPTVDSVGFGGFPDDSGTISLDACVMLAPERCGSVCAVTRHLHVTDLARLVMERTNHVMIAGEGADGFADASGMAPAELLSADAQAAWQKWKSGEVAAAPARVAAALGEIHVPHDTIGVLAIDAKGVMAGACSTSGLPYKMVGRVGDSPIPGHGLYVDPEVGGAVATGNGELIMGVSGSFLAVECLRRGATPIEAVREVLERIERRFHPSANQQIGVIALSKCGAWSAGALRKGFVVAVADAAGTRAVTPEFIMHKEEETTT